MFFVKNPRCTLSIWNRLFTKTVDLHNGQQHVKQQTTSNATPIASCIIIIFWYLYTAPASVAGTASNVFYFQFQSEMSHQQIVTATISIYVRRTPNPGLSATWLLLYRLGQLPSIPGESQERETMRRRRIEMSSLRDSGQWFTFDIRVHVERWILHQNVSYGIMVQVSDGRGEPLAIVQPQTPEEADRVRSSDDAQMIIIIASSLNVSFPVAVKHIWRPSGSGELPMRAT